MRKKRIISFSIVVVLLFVFFFVLEYKKKFEEEKRQQEIEDAIFDSQITAQYGSEDYLGRLDKKIIPYLIKMEAYPEGTWKLKGRYNIKKITNIYEAREVIYLLNKTLGIPNERDIFLYGNSNSSSYEISYTFFQFYKNVWVQPGRITVCVDLEGNTKEIRDYYVPEEMLERDIESVVPSLNQEEAKKLLEEKYGEQNWDKVQVQLYISEMPNNEEESKYVLVWRAEVTRYGDPYDVWMDANTGEILEEYSLIMCG